MTDAPNDTEITTTAHETSNFMSPSSFVEFISSISETVTSRDGAYLKMVVTERDAVFINGTVSADDHKVYSEETITDLKARYIAMLNGFLALTDDGFKLQRLEIIGKKDDNRITLEFLTPNNRKHTVHYRGQELAKIIPDDFLHDLKMFPSRYG